MPKNEITSAVAAAVAQVLPDAKDGEEFTLAGRTFTRQLLRIDGEQALTTVLVDLLRTSPDQEIGAMFLGALQVARRAAAIILADFDLPEDAFEQLPQATEEMEAWLSTTRGVTSAALLELILAQLRLQGVEDLLGRVYTIAVLTGIVAQPDPQPAA